MADPLTVRKRTQLFALRAQTIADLRNMWGAFDPKVDGSFAGFLLPAVSLVQHAARQAADTGLDYYLAMREKHAGAIEQRPLLPDPPERAMLEKSLSVTGLGGTLIALRAGKPLGAATDVGFVRVAMAAGRHVMNGARDAVLSATQADDAATGFRRVTTGTCDFCEQLAAEGEFKPGADFQAHDGCACVAEPVFNSRAAVGAEEQQAALNTWAHGAFQDVNDFLRATDQASFEPLEADLSDVRDTIAGLDAALANAAPLESDLTIHRFVDASWAQGFEEGDEFVDNGFVSTSRSSSWVSQRRSASRITTSVVVPRGGRVLDLGALGVRSDESEVLLARGTRFRVVWINRAVGTMGLEVV